MHQIITIQNFRMGNWPATKAISFYSQFVFNANQFHNMRSYYKSKNKYTNALYTPKQMYNIQGGNKRECLFTYTVAGNLLSIVFLSRFLKRGQMTLGIKTTLVILNSGVPKHQCVTVSTRL